jgi:hypothetical protein
MGSSRSAGSRAATTSRSDSTAFCTRLVRAPQALRRPAARRDTLGLMRFLVAFVIVAIDALAGAYGIAAVLMLAVGCIAKGFFVEVGREIAAETVRRLRSRKPLAAGPSWAKTRGRRWVPAEPTSTLLLSPVDTAATDDKKGPRDPAAERSSCG